MPKSIFIFQSLYHYCTKYKQYCTLCFIIVLFVNKQEHSNSMAEKIEIY